VLFSLLPPATREVLSVALVLAPAVTRINRQIKRALRDGEISADEAANIGSAVSREIGDVRIRFRGVDILDPDAQREILRGLARVVHASVTIASAGAADDEP
jgi:hypothetical protein